jgi:hypothetical protein
MTKKKTIKSMDNQPQGMVGYKVQTNIPCCANCSFGGYLGDVQESHRVCICEIFGEPSDGDYGRIATEPLGICDAYKPNLKEAIIWR